MTDYYQIPVYRLPTTILHLTKKRYSQFLLREWGVITFYILHKFMPLWQQHESKKLYDFPIKIEAKNMIISDLEYLENSNELDVTGGFLNFGGGDSNTSNTNNANFNTIITSALGILAPATALNNIAVIQSNGSVDASLL